MKSVVIDSGNCESGDVLLLMSDAVASWYLKCFENDDLAAEDSFFTRPDNEIGTSLTGMTPYRWMDQTDDRTELA
jgi:hypothetical protein